MPTVLAVLIAFVDEHRRCGEQDSGVEGDVVWMSGKCGAVPEADELDARSLPDRHFSFNLFFTGLSSSAPLPR
jgi:hypothetical protein